MQSNRPDLNHLALELLLQQNPSTLTPGNQASFARTFLLQSYIQYILYFITFDEWDAFQNLQLLTGLLVGATSAFGCFTNPSPNDALELFAAKEFVRVVLNFFLDMGYKFKRDPGETWPPDSPNAHVLNVKMNRMHTGQATKVTRTPVVDFQRRVAAVFTLEDDSGRQVQIMASNGSSMDLVLGMESTAFMNYISATHMTMLYPHATLERRVAVDFTKPQGVDVPLDAPNLQEGCIRVNPPLTAYDVANRDSDLTLLPRWPGDRFTLSILLPSIDLPYGSTWPGSQAVLSANSWELRFHTNNRAAIETKAYSHPSLQHKYTISPLADRILREVQPGQSILLPSQSSSSTNGHEDETFIVVMDDIYKSILTTKYQYVDAVDLIAGNMKMWCGPQCSLPTALTPSASMADATFRIISKLPPAANPNEIQTTFYPIQIPELDGKLWISIVIFLMQRPEPGVERTDDVPNLQSVHLDIHIAAFSLLKAITGILESSPSWTIADAAVVDSLTPEENGAIDALLATVLKKGYLSRFVEPTYQAMVDNPKAAQALPTMSLICQNCQATVKLPPPDTRWYCVVRGLRIGFVKGWDNVKRLVLHVPENKYVACIDREAARKIFILSVATREAQIVVTTDYAMTYDPLPVQDGFLYP
ncbi:hypothetical protein VNI00_005325 [Paramarasmius palmivorus]|uniref:Uncharacterized protein n=1 Tax=Paramarasmius palmivorus TaxID=297713 RepID=A0AAW0DDZ7_9AGAR